MKTTYIQETIEHWAHQHASAPDDSPVVAIDYPQPNETALRFTWGGYTVRTSVQQNGTVSLVAIEQETGKQWINIDRRCLSEAEVLDVVHQALHHLTFRKDSFIPRIPSVHPTV